MKEVVRVAQVNAQEAKEFKIEREKDISDLHFRKVFRRGSGTKKSV